MAHAQGRSSSAAGTGTPPASLYFGEVMHARLTPFRHKFRYRVFSLVVDIDRLDDIAAVSKVLRVNRRGLLSFHERDHGAGDGSPLRPWVEARLAQAGISVEGGTIRLLCFPRVLGYVFNPLSIYFAHAADGALRGIVYAVRNTFGEGHAYVVGVPEEDAGAPVLHQSARKIFHVSPFIGMDCTYRFALRAPDDLLRVAIRQTQGPEETPLLLATLTGRRVPFTDASLRKAFWSYPLLTFKIMGGIHWEALKLWWKGAKYHPNPKNRDRDVTLGRHEGRSD